MSSRALRGEVPLRRHGTGCWKAPSSDGDPVSATHHCVLRRARDDTEGDLCFPAWMNGFLIKICGISTAATMAAALDAGADMVGLVFHRKSPRSVSLELAARLAEQARGRAQVVALTVDPSDEGLDAIMAAINPEMFQLHGKESIERCGDIRERTGRPVMKAIGWSRSPGDYDDVMHFEHHVDRLLLDAKPPKDADYPGGHGVPFDWTTLNDFANPTDRSSGVDFMLSGGLTPENVGKAIRTVWDLGCSLQGVDVSSGVESAPGIKDVGKIRAFVEAARKATP
jgi:phosphoribosylanthranilate isomerase